MSVRLTSGPLCLCATPPPPPAAGGQPAAPADAAALQLPDRHGAAAGRADQRHEGAHRLAGGRRQVKKPADPSQTGPFMQRKGKKKASTPHFFIKCRALVPAPVCVFRLKPCVL